eukprot:EG_transcript_9396
MDAAEFVRNLHPEEAYHQTAMESFLTLMEYMNVLNTSADLYQRVCAIQLDGLTPEEVRCVQVFRQDMENNGISLPDNVRETVARVRNEIEELGGQLIAAHGSAAGAKEATMSALMERRAALATVLQEPSFAHNALANTIAGSPDAVWRFLTGLVAHLGPAVRQELQRLRETKHRNLSRVSRFTTAVSDVTVQDWELPTLVNQHLEALSQEQRIDRAAIREFLPFHRVWQGLLDLCHRVFGVRFHAVPLAPHEAWHPTVRKYSVHHTTDGYLGVLYVDLFQRPGKLRSAGHLTVQGGCAVHHAVLERLGQPAANARQPAVLVLTASLTAEPGREALLWHHDVETLFHEMGHALHTFCGHTVYQNLTGTRSSVDYAEFPSQFLELFARDYRVLSTFACHYKTGQPLPAELWKLACGVHFPGVNTLAEVMQASMDQLLHSPPPYQIPFQRDTVTLRAKSPHAAMEELGALYAAAATGGAEGCHPMGFAGMSSIDHFINYPALYYSYLYSKAFSRRAWHRFFAADPFSPTEGERFR